MKKEEKSLAERIAELEQEILYLKAGVEKDGSTTAVSSDD